MTGSKQICIAQFFPVQFPKVQKSAQFIHAERQERLETNGEVGCNLQADIEYSFYPFNIGFDYFPGFFVG